MRFAVLIGLVLLSACFDVPALPPGDPRPSSCDDCDNGNFCDGPERCEDGACVRGAPPCQPGAVCDEALKMCVSPPGEAGVDGGGRPDASMPDAAVPDAATFDAGPVDDCCDGQEVLPCMRNTCIGQECVASPVEDGDPCGANSQCQAGVCTPRCQSADDCGQAPGDCTRATCVDGVCGVAPCPGDVCLPGGCPACANAMACPPAPACHRVECFDSVCAAYFDPDGVCDDGDACFSGDHCNDTGECVPGNIPRCEAGAVCEPGEGMCSEPPDCVNDDDCPAGDRELCHAGACVECSVQGDCMGFVSPLCRNGECVCEGDGDCAHLNADCEWPSECATQGSITEGRCEARRCVARQVPGQCARPTDNRICNGAQGLCVDEVCQPPQAQVTVACEGGLRVRVTCADGDAIDTVCDGGAPRVVQCPRFERMAACCSSNLAVPCRAPGVPGGLVDVALQIQPALDDPRCAGADDGPNRECSGVLRHDARVTCSAE